MVPRQEFPRFLGWLSVLAMVLGGAGCYEIPPVLPKPAVPAGAPLPIYNADRYAPANRWFQRLFTPPESVGAISLDVAREPWPTETFMRSLHRRRSRRNRSPI